MIFARLAGLPNPLWLAAGMLGAFLTAYYTFRMMFIVSAPSRRYRKAPSAGKPTLPVMAAVLIILAVVTCGLGFFQDTLAHFLVRIGGQASISEGGHAAMLIVASLGLSLTGGLLAWYEFGRADALLNRVCGTPPPLGKFF